MSQNLKHICYFCLILFTSQCTDTDPKLTEGSWRGAIQYSDAEVPFQFEIGRADNSDSVSVTIINGSDRAATSGLISGDSLIVPMYAFDITLKAEIRGDSMSGFLYKAYRSTSVPFSAVYGEPRYTIDQSAVPAEIPEEMELMIRYDRDNAYPGVALMKQEGNRVSGTILSELSDFRFFEGKIEGDSLTMSSFDGVHSFLITGKKENGTWEGSIQFEEGYSEKWRQEEDPDSRIRDSFGIIDLSKERIKPDLSQFSLEGDPIDLKDYEGKVLMVQVFGTWCPNSWDQTRYLVSNYDRWSDLGVEILAVNYEANYSVEYGERRIRTYKEKLGIDYPVVLGGRLSKQEAAEAFSFIDRILAFPTLVIIDREGFARYVSSYYTGPATGIYYEDFKETLSGIIDELTASDQ